MVNKPIQVFKFMYIALSKVWEKEKDQKLEIFLTDANPFITGESSFDPKIFDDFESKFKAFGSYSDYGYDFIIKYLSILDPFYGDVKKCFERINKYQYIGESTQYSFMSDRELMRALSSR